MHPKLSETLSQYQEIILVGWGTGGHVQPIVSVIQYLKDSKNATFQQSNILWIGGKDSQEEQAARENNVEFISIPTFKLATTRSPKILLYPFVLIWWIFEARKILCPFISTEARYKRNGDSQYTPCEWILLDTWKRFLDFGYRLRSKWQCNKTKKQTCIFSKWWPWSVAVGIAAWTLWIPLYIHESDTIPGRSNHILGKIATKIFLGFDSAKKYFKGEKCEVIWQILGASFAKEVPDPSSAEVLLRRTEGRRIFSGKQKEISPTPLYKEGPSWKTSKNHILVICWSQWAKVIFEEILKNLEILIRDNEWIIILWKLNTDMRKLFEIKINTTTSRFLHTQEWQVPTIQLTDQPAIQLLDWISQEDLAHVIPDTDIAITRGSATTLAELTAFSPSNIPRFQHSNHPTLIIVPLPYAADNHQYWNAREYEKLWHILLEQKNLSELTQIIEKLWQNSPPSNI